MGTDIHFVAQKKVDGKWEDLTNQRWSGYDHTTKQDLYHDGEFKWDGPRNYYLFAWLANVRNGYGFAGVKTFEPVKPLTNNRGFPEDFKAGEWNEEAQDYTGGEYMGDHSFGWALGSEILAHPRRQVMQSGALSKDQYLALRDEGKIPESWSGGIFGPGITVVGSEDFQEALKNPSINQERLYVRATWVQKDDGLDRFISAVKEMCDKYGPDNFRLVFGFDS